jgi:hypothetical protein
MSVFTIDLVRQFAQNAFRFRPAKFSNSREEQIRAGKADRPLLGKPGTLLKALQKAERLFCRWQSEIQILRTMRSSDIELRRNCEALFGHLQDARTCISSLSKPAQDSLDSFAALARLDLSTIQSQLRRFVYIAKVASMDPCADASEAKRPERKGRKPDVGKNNVDLIPFEEFAKSLKGDWVRLTHRKFSFEALQAEWRRPIDREPTSAAAKLLYDAARALDNRIEVGHIEHIMRNIKAHPSFRKELLADVWIH